ncbi:hypothetical protein [Hahella ganghwensis]|uniref:hypothetical protein n=1 Tax=Hahella ganghwensis TaxID=286420 RepID=UPI0003748950|nr:hypothetical protein [Hahella ganghwensis]
MNIKVSTLLTVCLLVLSGCARQGYQDPELVASSECSNLWSEFQLQVIDAGVFEAQDWPLPKYPFLRVDRNASYLSRQGLSSQQQYRWLLQAYERGRFAREIENAKLEQPMELESLETCLRHVLPTLIDNRDFWNYVRQHPRPDAYSTARRRVGLYPLFQPIVSWRVNVLNEQVSSTFQEYEKDDSATWHRYVFPQRPEWDDIIKLFDESVHQDELGLPKFSIPEENQLLAYYSPVIEQEYGHPHDRIGRPFRLDGHWSVNEQPELFTMVTTTRWQGEWVPQLVYVWWYASRPKKHPFDILGGELDGLMWRVTLNWKGDVIFYDSVHPCGCYNKWFPAQEGIVFEGSSNTGEALSVLPVLSPGPEYRPVVRLNSEQHYVVGLEFEKAGQIKPGQSYQLSSYNELRQKPLGEDYLFGPDGIVPGTGRLEQLFIWNMGVVAAGSMRQWGHHATAFASRRHFDDPELFEHYFDWQPSVPEE